MKKTEEETELMRYAEPMGSESSARFRKMVNDKSPEEWAAIIKRKVPADYQGWVASIVIWVHRAMEKGPNPLFDISARYISKTPSFDLPDEERLASAIASELDLAKIMRKIGLIYFFPKGHRARYLPIVKKGKEEDEEDEEEEEV